MTTMKTYQALCRLFAASLAVASFACGAMTVQLNTPPTIRVGDTFDMDVVINDAFTGKGPLEEILAFGFDVTISDPSIVSLIGVSVAIPFDDDSAFFENTDVAGSVFPGIPNEGSNNTLPLATVTFQAMMSGTVSVGIASDLSDINEGLVYSLDPPADITASAGVAVVPLPTSIWLIGSGLVGLVGIARRKKAA
jgi:hypothetical protein